MNESSNFNLSQATHLLDRRMTMQERIHFQRSVRAHSLGARVKENNLSTTKILISLLGAQMIEPSKHSTGHRLSTKANMSQETMRYSLQNVIITHSVVGITVQEDRIHPGEILQIRSRIELHGTSLLMPITNVRLAIN